MIDPYHRWLGIPPAEQPANHYRLLALSNFESDPDVIEAAADQRMAHLRTFQTSQYNDLAERLLNEIAAAKICLLKPDRKATYDASLRSGVVLVQAVELPPEMPVQQPQQVPIFQAAPFHRPPPPPPTPPTPPPTPTAQPAPASVPIYDMVSEVGARPQPIRRNTTKKSNNNMALIVLGPLIGIVVVALVLILRNNSDDDPDQPQKSTEASQSYQSSYKTVTKSEQYQQRIEKRVQPPPPPPHLSFAGFLSLGDPIIADFSDSFRDYQDLLMSIKSLDLSKWQPKKEPIPPIKLTFEEKVSKVGGRGVANDEQIEIVKAFAPSAVDLHISVHWESAKPDHRIILEQQPETIEVSFTVSRGKGNSLLVHVKPWWGPSDGANSVPCTVGRLQTLQTNLPTIIDNENAGFQNTQEFIQNLEQQRQTLQNTTVDASQVGAKGAALQQINAHLTTQYGKLRTFQNAAARDSAKLARIPEVIKQVQGFVGTEVQFRIYYIRNNIRITVAQSDDYNPDNGGVAAPAAAKK